MMVYWSWFPKGWCPYPSQAWEAENVSTALRQIKSHLLGLPQVVAGPDWWPIEMYSGESRGRELSAIGMRLCKPVYTDADGDLVAFLFTDEVKST